MLEDTIDDIEVHPDLLSRNNWQQKQQENDYDHNDITAEEAEEVLGDLRDLLWQQPQPIERPIALMNIGGEDSAFNIQEASIGGNFDDINDGGGDGPLTPELAEDLDMGTIDTMGKYL